MNENRMMIEGMPFEVLRNGKGRPLLFLHGYGAHPEIYRSFLRKAAADFDVHAPALFGMNYLSDQSLKPADFQRLILGYLKKTGIEKPLVIGHSYGAVIAFLMGHDDQAEKIAVVNPIIPQPFNRARFQHTFQIMLKDWRDHRGETQGLVRNPGVLLRYASNALANVPEYVRGGLAGNDFSLRQLHIKPPSYLLHTDSDMMFPFQESQKRDFEQSFANIRIEILKNYSHNWMIYHPELAWEKLRTFLEASHE